MSSQENKPGAGVSKQEEIENSDKNNQENQVVSPEDVESNNEEKLSNTIEQSSSKIASVENEAKRISPSQTARIEESGSMTALNEKTGEVDKKIESAKVETNQKVLGELMNQFNDWKAKLEKNSRSAPRAIKYTVDEVTKFCNKNGIPIPKEILDATQAPKEKTKKEKAPQALSTKPAEVNTNVETPQVEQVSGPEKPVETQQEETSVEQTVAEAPAVEQPKPIETKHEEGVEKTPVAEPKNEVVFQKIATLPPVENIEASKMSETIRNLVMNNQEIEKRIQARAIDTDDIRAIITSAIRNEDLSVSELNFIVEGNKANFSQKLNDAIEENVKKLNLNGNKKLESLKSQLDITGQEERSKKADDRFIKIGSQTKRIVSRE